MLLTSFAASRNQSLAVLALVMVSWVVNVLEAMTKRVVSGFSLLNKNVTYVTI